MYNTLRSFAAAKVLVVGDVMLDRYWHGGTSRISPEAPVPVVHVQQMEDRLGGAANVALNIRSLGAQSHLIGLLGDDEAGRSLENKLQVATVEHSLERIAGIPTITKLRVMSRNQQLLRLDFEDEKQHSITPANLLADFKKQLATAQVVLLSDYGKGTIRDPQEYIQLARAQNVAVLVDPKGKDFARYRGASLLTPNLKEFEMVVGTCQSEDDLVAKGQQAIKDYDLQALLITRSEHGMTLLQPNQHATHFPARTKEVFDVTGAGDTVIAVLAVALASGVDREDAVKLANLAASIVVGRMGAASVTFAELRRVLHKVQGDERGILTEEQLVAMCSDAKDHGEKIVMTNGCFDILHAGHVAYLRQAKALGDRLVVAVNDDASVKRLKGAARPINSLAQRQAVLAALAHVDWVVTFAEDTPARLIDLVKPDVLVKGGDYSAETIVGADTVIANGGQVKVLPFVDGCSTSKIIENILEDTL